MLITNENYRQALRRLKKEYSDLPWYQRWWFSLWAYSLSDALSDIDLINPTTEQVDELVKMSDESWFFNSIFGLLTQFKEVIGKLSFSGQRKETKIEIGIRLPPKDLVALASTTPAHYAFFESLRLPSQFLHAVAHGEYDIVAALLEKDINLLLDKGQVTDASGRRFFHITGFQYALWALDKHMWIKILQCLPRNEKGATIKAKLLQQYQELKEIGVAYELNGKRVRESHFDFENTIIKEIKTQFQLHEHDFDHGFKNWVEIGKQWCEGVGSAQKLLPMHVVYEYCSEEPFYPPPKFKQPPPMIKQFYNSLNNKYEDWFHSGSRLGEDFAIAKGAGSMAIQALEVRLNGRSAGLWAMETLFEVRTEDFIELESLLKEPLAPEDQFSASP